MRVNALNRTTKQFVVGANAADHPVADWISDPDLSAVIGQPEKYWKIVGDVVSLMSPAERTAADNASLAVARDAVATSMDRPEDFARAFALIILDELNLHAARITAILDAIDSAATLAALKTSVAAIQDVPQRTVEQLKTALRNKLGN